MSSKSNGPMPHTLPNGAWIIPFSSCFVMKNMSDFDATQCSMEVAMTLILRVKFTGIPEAAKVMNWVLENLKCRVNEEEGLISNDDTRVGKHNIVCSSDWKDEYK